MPVKAYIRKDFAKKMFQTRKFPGRKLYKCIENEKVR